MRQESSGEMLSLVSEEGDGDTRAGHHQGIKLGEKAKSNTPEWVNWQIGKSAAASGQNKR